MNTLNKICTALTVVFAVSLAVLVAEILYVLWRRRRFQNRSLATGDVEFSGESFYSTPSKELLYFFCWKNQASRIEPDAETTSAAAVAAPPLPSPPSTDVDVDVDVDEILKRHALYGPSRVLFTIKEEEKEEMETDLSSTENEEKKNKKKKKKKSVSLEELAVASMATVIDIDETTPYSTPCASPPYYTPSPSPSRDRNPPQTSTEDQNDVVALYSDYDDSIEVRAS